MMFPKKAVLIVASILLVSACTGKHPGTDDIEGQYWQRNTAESALYLRGPEAQHKLHGDIAHCAAEVREMQYLAGIRNTAPPHRHAPIYQEHKGFTDFETCMHANGWERVDYVPYATKERAHRTYLHAMEGIAPRSRIGRSTKPPEDGDFDHLNE